MSAVFDHEKLKVYQQAIDFVAWTSQFLDQISASSNLHSQLDRASTSIPLNIAEGNGKWTRKDRCRFFDIARGSALECAAALDVSVAKKMIAPSEITSGKESLAELVRMLVGLIKANDPDREFGGGVTVREEAVHYLDQDQE